MNPDPWRWLLKKLGVPYIGWSWRHGSLEPDMLNAPYGYVGGTEDGRHAEVAVSWGNGNSDPVWSVHWKMRVPRVLGSRLPL